MLTLGVVASIGIIILITGYTSWKYLLNQNACNMTYSKIDKKEVIVNTNFMQNGKLYFYKNSKTTKLNKSNKMKSKKQWDYSLSHHPVLFIPGHGGK
jgi:hypothetical protein